MRLIERLGETPADGGQQREQSEPVEIVLDCHRFIVCCAHKFDPIQEDRNGQQQERHKTDGFVHTAYRHREHRRDASRQCHELRLDERPEARRAPQVGKVIADQVVREQNGADACDRREQLSVE